MPYVSEKQRRFFHTETARKRGITPAMVHEWDQASKGESRPESDEKRGAQNFSRQGVRPQAGFGAQHPIGRPQHREQPSQVGATPGGIHQQFLDGSVQKAQGASDAIFSNSAGLTMPVTR